MGLMCYFMVITEKQFYGKLGVMRVVTRQLGFTRPFSIKYFFDEEMLFQLSWGEVDVRLKPATRLFMALAYLMPYFKVISFVKSFYKNMSKRNVVGGFSEVGSYPRITQY